MTNYQECEEYSFIFDIFIYKSYFREYLCLASFYLRSFFHKSPMKDVFHSILFYRYHFFILITVIVHTNMKKRKKFKGFNNIEKGRKSEKEVKDSEETMAMAWSAPASFSTSPPIHRHLRCAALPFAASGALFVSVARSSPFSVPSFAADRPKIAPFASISAAMASSTLGEHV